MSYNTIAEMADDPFLIGRLTACAAEEEKPKPYQAWVLEHRWDLVVTPGWIEAWESAEAGGAQDIGSNPDVITDAMILAAVQEDVAPEPPDPEPEPEPEPSDNVWTSGATLTTTTDADGTLWQIGTRTTTAAVRLLSLITGPELQPSSWYRFRATARQPSEFFLDNIAFRPDVNSGTDGVIFATRITIPAGESELDFTFQTSAVALTENAGIAFVSTSGAVGDFLQIRDDATVEPTAAPPQPAGNVWLEDDFSTASVGPMTSSYLYENWVKAGIGAGLERASVVNDNGINRVRISLPKGAVGADNSGSTWRCTFPGTLEATAEYWLRFDPDFDWTKGGKLPGLCGGSNPVGGDPDPNGFSARYMWVDGGRLILYLYWAGQDGQYGDDLQVGYVQPEGTVLKQRIKMNTPGVADGELQVWNDGVLKVNRKDMKWRLSGATWNITSFYWNVFHGGNNADYAPDRNNWIDFDRVLVTVGASTE